MPIRFEWGLHLHVEYRDGGEGTRVPLRFVVLEGGVETVGEFTDDGDGPFGAWEVLLFRTVDCLFEDKQGNDQCEDSGSDGFAI